MPRHKFKTVEEYISTFPKDTQVILEKIRALIRKQVPEATETISYNIPAFFLNGTYLAYYSGYEHHVSLYPIPTGPASFKKKIEPHVFGKGTLRFSLDAPIDYELIKEILDYAEQANALRAKKR